MPNAILFSETNCQNSIAIFFAQWLLTNGYLVYWHERDGVETADGYYGQYSTRQDALALDATFAGRLAAAKALVTLRGPLTAIPRFVARPSSSGHVEGQDQVAVPAFVVEIGTAAPMSNYELGTAQKWRGRRLTVAGFARTKAEQSLFADALSVVFDADIHIDVRDHDSGSLAAVGAVRVLRPMVDRELDIEGPVPSTYAVEMNARLEYVA